MPHTLAPVIVEEKNHPVLRLFNFSLIPKWSKEKRVKFATHNARLETIAEKPTWKGPLQNFRCLIPMTGFIEPIYVKKYAGNMVEFFPRKNNILLAAGICDQWTDKSTGEVIDSFSIVTSDPPEFVKKIGHDRCPVFLDQESAEKWIVSEKKSASDLVRFLGDHAVVPDLDVKIERPMKPGWEKRIPKD